MQFYQITHPDGRLEFATVGTEASKRAKEIGGKSEAIEVETNKQGLLAMFNKLAGSAPTPDASSVSEPEEGPIHQHKGNNEPCPKCKWTPKMCEGYIKQKLRGLTVDAMKEWIDTREGWELSTIVESITYRLSELAQSVSGKKEA